MHNWYPLRYVSTLIWMGFLLGISFMEAPLKFQAPSVTLAIGLEIGQLVFGALNRVEWILFLLLLLSMWLAKTDRMANLGVSCILIVLSFQTVYLLPELDLRADAIIAGASVPDSNIHFYYVGLEVVKLILLALVSLHFIYNQSRHAN